MHTAGIHWCWERERGVHMLGVVQAGTLISQWEAEQGEPQGGSPSASLPLVKFGCLFS